MRFSCRTYFDITATGVTGHYKSSRVPFVDNNNQRIENELNWNRARNQQRNWETITQLIGMRTQINFQQDPIKNKDAWEFEFEVDAPAVFGSETNPVELLLSDAEGVPMLVGLDERKKLDAVLVVSGARQNIWFKALP
jgi:hypothetical protein